MLNSDQFLPGMERMREALPHEQTEAQFHNRPDVYVHGRYVPLDQGSVLMNRRAVFDGKPGQGFHAGTAKAAHDRLNALDAPYYGFEARFYHGRVDPMKMKNTPATGKWEAGFPDTMSLSNPFNQPTRRTDDPGREVDQVDEWRPIHHDSYYRNDYEDEGSTSVILGAEPVGYRVQNEFGQTHTRTDFTPRNFQTWRSAVGQALGRGEDVPHHVRALYEASGGHHGHHGVVHADFKTPTVAWPAGFRFNTTYPAVNYEQQDRHIPGMHANTLQAAQFPKDAFN